MDEPDRFLAELARRYPLTCVSRRFGDHEFHLTCVRDQDALLAGVTDEAGVDEFPFGLLLWPSAIALAEQIAREPGLVAGKRVLEIGAGGVGLPGFAAREAGAASVLQTDYHAESLALLARNATQNGCAGHVRQTAGDWRAFPDLGQPFDVVIGSDVLYARPLHDALMELLPQLVAPGGRLLISDPMRPQALAFIGRMEMEAIDTWLLPVDMTGHRVICPDGKSHEIAIFRAIRKEL